MKTYNKNLEAASLLRREQVVFKSSSNATSAQFQNEHSIPYTTARVPEVTALTTGS
jgi:hypothetical protein